MDVEGHDRKTYVNERITIAELAYDWPTSSDGKHVTANFFRCELVGPAVVTIGDDCTFVGRADLYGTSQDMFRTLAQGEPMPPDTLTLTRCTFERCIFHSSVVFVSNDAAENRFIRAEFGLTTLD